MDKTKFVQFVKKPIVVVSFLLAVCLVFIAWNWGWKKVETGIYDRGVVAGANQVSNAVIQQLLQTGKITINLPMNEQGQYDANGTVRTIILIPQTNN